MAIDLSNLTAGSGGFVINGESADDRSGWSVSAAGDVNGDTYIVDNIGDVVTENSGTDTGFFRTIPSCLDGRMAENVSYSGNSVGYRSAR